jgi:hypothetical protein
MGYVVLLTKKAKEIAQAHEEAIAADTEPTTKDGVRRPGSTVIHLEPR